VGFEAGGPLVDAVRKHRHAMLLLDEIEKPFTPEFRNRLFVALKDGGTAKVERKGDGLGITTKGK
jgi:ATP-dependent Clp protease ATP-binding subunit ClpA